MKYICAECESPVPSMDPCPWCGSIRTVLAEVAPRHFPQEVAQIRATARDPFRITGPAIVSFSGGRTSALMLYRVIEAHNGTLPGNVKVIFANTGKEWPETLDFVERCSQRWGVEIHWVEYQLTAPVPCPTRCQQWSGMSDDEKTAAWDAWHVAMASYRTADEPAVAGRVAKKSTQRKPWDNGFRCVDYATACRNGEPFEECIIAHKMLPNVVTRFCTQELKIRPMRKLVRSWGWEHWTVCIGIRADEPRRLAKARDNPIRERYEVVHPLGDSKATIADVRAFWKSQRGEMELRDWLDTPAAKRPGWDLELPEGDGNCDYCFLKSPEKRIALMRRRPEAAQWWIRMEAAADRRGLAVNPSVALFRKDCPRYSALVNRSRTQLILPGMEDDCDDQLSASCSCTD